MSTAAAVIPAVAPWTDRLTVPSKYITLAYRLRGSATVVYPLIDQPAPESMRCARHGVIPMQAAGVHLVEIDLIDLPEDSMLEIERPNGRPLRTRIRA